MGSLLLLFTKYFINVVSGYTRVKRIAKMPVLKSVLFLFIINVLLLIFWISCHLMLV